MEIGKVRSCELPTRATQTEHHSTRHSMRHTSRLKDKKLPSPKVCSDCGGLFPLAFDPDARRYFDNSTFCHCRAVHGGDGIA
jgi:hypothetical protein